MWTKDQGGHGFLRFPKPAMRARARYESWNITKPWSTLVHPWGGVTDNKLPIGWKLFIRNER